MLAEKFNAPVSQEGPQFMVLVQIQTKTFLETAFFNVQTIREIEIENKKLGGLKKGFHSFY